MKNRSIILTTLAATLALSACGHKPDIDKAQYWQRTTASDMAYINGPKAQQMLNRDIARCVTELRELERLGQIKSPIKVNNINRSLNPDKRRLSDIDATDRDGYLLAEHSNYQDFEACMDANGWDRTNSVNYDVADRAKKNFFQVVHDSYLGKANTEKAKSVNSYENDYNVNN